jgi:hypothetical protein
LQGFETDRSETGVEGGDLLELLGEELLAVVGKDALDDLRNAGGDIRRGEFIAEHLLDIAIRPDGRHTALKRREKGVLAILKCIVKWIR